jgi:hypothetical protein
MNNKKLLTALIMVALFVWAYNFYQVRSRLAGGAISDKTSEIGRDKFVIQERVTDYDASIRDPFKPPIITVQAIIKKDPKKETKAPAVAEPPPFSINGIMWDPKSPSAMLQDNRNQETRTVERGAVWDDLIITGITQSGVKVKYKGKDFEIK